MRGALCLDGARKEVAHARLRIELREQRTRSVFVRRRHGASPFG